MTLTIPTLLTIFRIALIPVLVLVFYWQHPWSNVITTAVFVVGALTDWLDGWVARRFNMHSAFGAFLDPVADKLAVTVALFLVVQAHPSAWMALLSAVIVGREITISALREWMARVGKSASVAVAYVGKLKTTAQMVAIPLLLFNAPLYGIDMRIAGNILIYVAAALTLWSMGYYLHRAIPLLQDEAGQ